MVPLVKVLPDFLVMIFRESHVWVRRVANICMESSRNQWCRPVWLTQIVGGESA